MSVFSSVFAGRPHAGVRFGMVAGKQRLLAADQVGPSVSLPTACRPPTRNVQPLAQASS